MEEQGTGRGSDGAKVRRPPQFSAFVPVLLLPGTLSICSAESVWDAAQSEVEVPEHLCLSGWSNMAQQSTPPS